MRPLRTAAAALLLGSLLAASHPVAHADPLGDARSQAAVLRAKVHDLQIKAEIATEAYDAVNAQLGAAVTAHLTAEQDLARAEQAAGDTDQLAGRRVRALYMAGGTAGLYAKVLDSSSIGEVAQRVHQVGIVLADDSRASLSADEAVALRADATRRLAATSARSTELQRKVSQKADAVRALLAQTDALLAAADQKVRDLVAAQQRQLDAAASAQASQSLAAARAAMGNLPEVPPSAEAAGALAFAKTQVGKPYVWGATGPDAYDCSGFTGAAYRAAGVSLPRTSRQQWFAGSLVPFGAWMPGDLLFWANDSNNPATIHHVAIYAGGGLMYAAPHSGDVVKLQGVYLEGFIGAVRPAVS